VNGPQRNQASDVVIRVYINRLPASALRLLPAAIAAAKISDVQSNILILQTFEKILRVNTKSLHIGLTIEKCLMQYIQSKCGYENQTISIVSLTRSSPVAEKPRDAVHYI